MQCPLLCKEFVIDKWQIYYARSQGADAILLIAAVLPDLDIKYFLRICKELGMTALIEVSHCFIFCNNDFFFLILEGPMNWKLAYII